MNLYTTRINSDHPNTLDITYMSGATGPGKFFAPTRKMVDDHKTGKITWEQYCDNYRQLLRTRWRKHQHWLSEFFQAAGDEVAIACYCNDNLCHRYLVAEEILPQIEKNITYIGEWGKVRRENALIVANELVDLFAPVVDQIEIAGSIRRGNNWVGDVELVLMPHDEWYSLTDSLLADGVFQVGDNKGWGDKQRKFVYKGFKIDSYCAEPSNWGYILTLRTGPDSFNKVLMQAKRPMEFKNGMLIYNQGLLHVPDEETFFAILGIDYISPQDRSKQSLERAFAPPHEWPDLRQYKLYDQQVLVDAPIISVIASDGRTYDNPLVVQHIEEIERNLKHFRWVRDINAEIARLYDAQKPYPLLDVDVIRDRMEHSLDLLSFYTRRYRFVHLLPLVVYRQFHALIIWMSIVQCVQGVKLEMADYQALYDYQWIDAGAKRYWEIYTDNEWRFDEVMT